MIVYSRNPKHDPPRGREDRVATCWEYLSHFLLRWGRGFDGPEGGVLIELQPGDGTKYLFSLARSGSKVVLACVCGGTWAAELDASSPVEPEGLADCARAMVLNPHTAAVACDVFNAAMGHDVERFYDWEAARPL